VSSTTLSPTVAKALTPEKVTAKSKSNFSLSFWFLPKVQRQGITNFYALSRVIDDAVDEFGPEEGEGLLNFWKREIDLCYDGEPTHPLTQAMQDTIRRFNIPQGYLHLLIEGCEMDLKKNRYATWEELQAYCYRVAGVIGLICMKIFGLDGQEAEQAAEDLGLALQLTNILRDIQSDAQRNRIYIPQEDLNRYKLQEEQLVQGIKGPRLFNLLKLMADRAETQFNRAFTRMKKLPHRPLVAAWIMGRVYERLLQKIKAKKYDVYSGKIRVSKLNKLRIVLRELLSLRGDRRRQTPKQ